MSGVAVDTADSRAGFPFGERHGRERRRVPHASPLPASVPIAPNARACRARSTPPQSLPRARKTPPQALVCGDELRQPPGGGDDHVRPLRQLLGLLLLLHAADDDALLVWGSVGEGTCAVGDPHATAFCSRELLLRVCISKAGLLSTAPGRSKSPRAGRRTRRFMPAPKARNCSASCTASSLQGLGLIPCVQAMSTPRRGARAACVSGADAIRSAGAALQTRQCGVHRGQPPDCAAHLVGVSTSANTPKGSFASRCSMGSANAAVLPLPVCAVPITSRPARTAGMQPRCTGVGCAMPRDDSTPHSQSLRPRSLNEVSPLSSSCRRCSTWPLVEASPRARSGCCGECSSASGSAPPPFGSLLGFSGFSILTPDAARLRLPGLKSWNAESSIPPGAFSGVLGVQSGPYQAQKQIGMGRGVLCCVVVRTARQTAGAAPRCRAAAAPALTLRRRPVGQPWPPCTQPATPDRIVTRPHHGRVTRAAAALRLLHARPGPGPAIDRSCRAVPGRGKTARIPAQRRAPRAVVRSLS